MYSNIVKECKKDLQQVCTRFQGDKKFEDLSHTVNMIVSRSHNFNSLKFQIETYIKRVISRKKWIIFRVGHSKCTREINKVIEYHSQEHRIIQLNQEIAILKKENKIMHDLMEKEKQELKMSLQSKLLILQKKNAELIQKITALLDYPKETKHKKFIPKLAAIVDVVSQNSVNS